MIYSHGISVVIPTFNRMSKVRKAIQSVLAQNHEAEEVIVVDNNSTDNTREMIKSDFLFPKPYSLFLRKPSFFRGNNPN